MYLYAVRVCKLRQVLPQAYKRIMKNSFESLCPRYRACNIRGRKFVVANEMNFDKYMLDPFF